MVSVQFFIALMAQEVRRDGTMTSAELRERTRRFAVAVALAMKPLRSRPSAGHAADQAARASASVAANYRATCIAQSRAAFIAKLAVVLEEADETVYWLGYLEDVEGPAESLAASLQEARELSRIFAASRRTAKRQRPR